MSRADRFHARKIEAMFTPRQRYRDGGKLVDAKTGAPIMRDPWWPSRFVDLVERRSDGDTKRVHGRDVAVPSPRVKPEAKPAPKRCAIPDRTEILRRPPGMTRQTARRLYRKACKRAGVPFSITKAERLIANKWLEAELAALAKVKP